LEILGILVPNSKRLLAQQEPTWLKIWLYLRLAVSISWNEDKDDEQLHHTLHHAENEKSRLTAAFLFSRKRKL
jgi:hypothetical protein